MIHKLLLAILFLSAAVQAQQVSTYWQSGTQVVVQTLDGVTVQACIAQNDNYNYARVDVRVVNQSDKAFDVQPELFLLLQTTPKQVDLKQVPEKDLQKSLSIHAAFWNLVNGFSSAFASEAPSTTTTGGSGYTAASVIRTTNYATAGTQRSLADSAKAAKDGINETFLRRTTVYPEKSVTGSVFFRRASKFDGAVLTVAMGENKFILPFGTATPASAAVAIPQELSVIPGNPAFAPSVVNMATLGISGDARSAYGFFVTAVAHNSPAEHAKIIAGDLIVAVNGTTVRSESDIMELIPPNAVVIQMEVARASWSAAYTEKRVLTLE